MHDEGGRGLVARRLLEVDVIVVQPSAVVVLMAFGVFDVDWWREDSCAETSVIGVELRGKCR